MKRQEQEIADRISGQIASSSSPVANGAASLAAGAAVVAAANAEAGQAVADADAEAGADEVVDPEIFRTPLEGEMSQSFQTQ